MAEHFDKLGNAHENQYNADMANIAMGRGDNSGGFGSTFGGGSDAISGLIGSLGPLAKIACIIPSLVSALIGLIVGALFKLGLPGRIILTALFGFCVFVLEAFPLQFFHGSENGILEFVGLMLALAITLPAAAWFFIRHYHTIKNTPLAIFTGYMTVCGTIVFWGIIILGAVGQFTGLTQYGWSSGAIILIPFMAAAMLWLKLTGEKPQLMLIVLAVVLALIVTDIISSDIARAQRANARKAAIVKQAETKPAVLIVLRETPFEATLIADTPGKLPREYGQDIVVPAGSAVTVSSFTSVVTEEGPGYWATLRFNGREVEIRQLDTIKPVE